MRTGHLPPVMFPKQMVVLSGSKGRGSDLDRIVILYKELKTTAFTRTLQVHA